MLILANDELFEFCVSCGEFGGNMKVFVEFVLRLIFVDLKLSQNPYMPTTRQRQATEPERPAVRWGKSRAH